MRPARALAGRWLQRRGAVGAILSCALWLAVAGCVLRPGPAAAHATPIAVLELEETRSGQFIARWDYNSVAGEAGPEAIFPEHCVYREPRLDCGRVGLVGSIGVAGLGERFSAVVVRITRDGITASYTLTGAHPRISVAADAGGWSGRLVMLRTYTGLGIEHILLGVDHLLFVLGLIWLVGSPWMLVRTITAFTIAHSITLGAATLGWVGVPERAVNAAIALSIVFVAVEAVKLHQGQVGFTARHPWVVAFAFGLLHGFGFANALTELGLTPDSVPWALLAFNVGVEIGQLGFVLLVLALLRAHRVLALDMPRWGTVIPAYTVGSVASFWFLGRVMAIVSPSGSP
jgi:hypothetical protein